MRLFACRLGSFDPGMRRHTGYVVPAVLEDGNKGFFVYVYPTGWYAPTLPLGPWRAKLADSLAHGIRVRSVT